QLSYHSHTDRQHHQCRSCVGNPHGQKCGGDHKAQNDSFQVSAYDRNDSQGYAFVQVPFFYRHGNHEATHVEQNHGIRIGNRGVFYSHDTQQWKQNQRQQRSGRDRDSLGDPPNGHPAGGSHHGHTFG